MLETAADPTLSGALGTLAQAARLLGVADLAEQATQVMGRLEGLVLEVAVVGEFKRGKSSLINALLDDEVLPVGVLPLTAVPTVLERGDPALLVEFGDTRVEEHPLSQVGRFVTEEHNPGNRLGVAHVTARLHTPLLDEGVRLVDTPGVGSVHEHNTLATDAYLPSLDAAVLVTSADPPISKAETAFLERVVEYAVRLFVVLNKADYLTPAELDSTVAFTERVVCEVLPDWPGPVYALSARAGVGDPAALRRFRADLERFLRTQRAATVGDSARRSGQRLLGGLWLALDLERHAAIPPADELAQRRRRLEQTIQRLADNAAADAALLQAAVRRALEALDETVRAGVAGLERQAVQATEQAAQAHIDLGPGKLLEVLQSERPALLERMCRPRPRHRQGPRPGRRRDPHGLRAAARRDVPAARRGRPPARRPPAAPPGRTGRQPGRRGRAQPRAGRPGRGGPHPAHHGAGPDRRPAGAGRGRARRSLTAPASAIDGRAGLVADHKDSLLGRRNKLYGPEARRRGGEIDG